MRAIPSRIGNKCSAQNRRQGQNATEDIKAYFVSAEANKASKNETVPAALKAAKRSPLTSLQ